MRIGIIDSGKGGTFIGSKLKYYFNVDIEQWIPPYFVSYSNITLDELSRLVDIHCEYLVSKQVNIIVIGCMTISTNLKEYIDSKVNLPVYDLYNCLPIFDKDTLVIGTTNTIKSSKFNDYITLACPDIAGAIENNCEAIIEGLLRRYEHTLTYTHPFSKVILGCSHYSIHRSIFERYYNKTIIDPSDYLINKIKSIL